MAEPLRKSMIVVSRFVDKDDGRGQWINMINLKSALDFYEESINQILDADSCLVLAKFRLRKAFPAIYEPTNKGSEVEKEKGDE